MAWVLEKQTSSGHAVGATLGVLAGKKVKITLENVTWTGATGFLFSQAEAVSSEREFGLLAGSGNFSTYLNGSSSVLCPKQSIDNETVEYEADYSTGEVTLTIGGTILVNKIAPVGTQTPQNSFRFFARGVGYYAPNGTRVGNTSIYIDDVLVRYYNATASDHNGTTPQPILIDTIGGNDATGVNFPTIGANYDPSVWIDLGGGPTFQPFWLKRNTIIY